MKHPRSIAGIGALLALLAALLLGAAPASAATANVSSSLDASDPVFNRPSEGTPPTTHDLGPVDDPHGDAAPYETLPLAVSQTGTYTVHMTTPSPVSLTADPFVCVYANPFNAASSLTNAITCNDDEGDFNLNQVNSLATVTLTAGTPYCVVATTFDNGHYFPYTVTVDGPGTPTLGPVGGACNGPAAGAPVCTVVKTDWRAPYKSGLCPSGETLHQIATTTGTGLTVCTKVGEDWRAPDNAGCPVGFTTQKVVTTAVGGLPVCVKYDIDWRDPNKDGSCPVGETLYRVVEAGPTGPAG